MKTFIQFMTICEAAYDKEVMSGSQIRTVGAGGRISAERKKTKPEIRRTKRVGGGKTEPVSYKERSDIGKQREVSTRVQQPEKERGSAAAAQSAAARQERIKAARERAAAKRSGQTTSQSKPKTKDIEKQATQLLSKRVSVKPKAPAKDPRFSSSRDPEDHMIKGKYTKVEKKKIVRAGKRLHRDIVKGIEKPASHYQP